MRITKRELESMILSRVAAIPGVNRYELSEDIRETVGYQHPVSSCIGSLLSDDRFLKEKAVLVSWYSVDGVDVFGNKRWSSKVAVKEVDCG